jgi:hypothetical protein
MVGGLEHPLVRSAESKRTMLRIPRRLILGTTAALVMAVAAVGTVAAQPGEMADFEMKVASSAAACLPDAKAEGHINAIGPVEIMTVDVLGLPPKTDFDFFVIQVPKAPFGVAWYQGDIETNAKGKGHGRFIGRFNIETFAVAPGVAPAPLVFNDQPS